MSRIHTDTLNETKKNGMMHLDTKLRNSWREGERARWTNKLTQANARQNQRGWTEIDKFMTQACHQQLQNAGSMISIHIA
jgi:hypothetical protein